MRSRAVFAIAACLVAHSVFGAEPAATVADAPVAPAAAPGRMTLPEGFAVSLFAGEPDVVQPIAFCIDARGRLWVVENYSYPQWKPESKDRVLILEDRDHDGTFDQRTVFWDQGSNLTGIQLGFGGVWLCSTPNLVFVPDRDGDDVPDGPAEVKLDGWDRGGKHNVFNALNWGPDGWLYGCNGILSNSKVGPPGTPDERRVAINCGVWRYHPTRATFEAVAWGTTNPWGLDFDDHGQMFITNCVIHHLWHVVPGAHFQRMFGQDLNPYVFGLIQSTADHIHWAGGPWQESRGNQEKHSGSGGGHAHAGAMIYLGDNWPDEYRTRLLTCNIHGNRVNSDLLERHGSGFVAKHGPDFMSAGDSWFRGLELKYGPDGGVYLTDWCDTGECHDYDDVHRTSGRIYKITHGATKPVDIDIARLSDVELVKLQLHKNDHFVRHARRVLQERAAAAKLQPTTRPALLTLLREQSEPTRQLRALWALHVTGGIDAKLTLELLDNKDEYLRAWAIQLDSEDRQVAPPVAAKLVALAASDPSPFVRLYLASAMQRMSGDTLWNVAQNLAAHGEDADDDYLPLMIWYGIEPAVANDTPRAAQLAAKAKIPLLRRFIARRIATDLDALVAATASVHQPAVQLDLLRGMHEALRGRRRIEPPKQWSALATRLAKSPDNDVRNTTQLLSLIFGDPATTTKLRALVEDPQANATARQAALVALVEVKDTSLAPALQKLVSDRQVRGAAIRGLAVYDDPATPAVILKHYAALTDAEKQDAVSTLSSRKKYAAVLFEAMRKGTIARDDVSAFAVQQLLGLGDDAIATELSKHWGTARATTEEKAASIAAFKARLTADHLASANLEAGRQLFTRTCATCHSLFGTGARTGPDLTGSQRNNLDYVLLHVVDPSAVVGRDYQMTLLETDEGRIISGIIKQEDDNTLVMQTANESVILPKSEIADRKKLTVSMMPDGLLSKLSEAEVRDLIGYLASPKQILLPGEKPVGGK